MMKPLKSLATLAILSIGALGFQTSVLAQNLLLNGDFELLPPEFPRLGVG